MRRLFPVTDETVPTTPGEEGGAGDAGVLDALTEREWSLAELAAAYAYPEPTAAGQPVPWLRANMVSTLDGAAQHDGRSQPISSATDMRIFGTLRALADVVVVGAETVRQEGYRPARARADFAEMREAAGQGAAPAIAVVTASLDLDFSLPLFTSPLVPTLVLTGAAAPPDRIAVAEKAGARVVIAGDGMGVEPARAVQALGAIGYTRLLTEGGPRLLGQLVAAGVLDELCLAVSPMLTAGHAQRIAGGPSVAVPQRFVLASVLEEEGFLFTRYQRS
ncbi:pyrimidine reductase family protein [Streptomyces sp. NBC_00201]|uniref:pyrimidine reductase family protein n=1 Tax=unclassified Streptomyces TaxID=2593676 RepID=UPI00225A13AD|nr:MULTISPECIES: pyrimidine reductase family protein [unclassified Streptomyces]MCX5062095.1 pyrimidine reductase family protein [Streptomyces sp. NBC_00452]MCX5249660.1 pyrimidine reductase family protein [Streptomyces sp. NBC_00201]MCX5292296.1 pyrimidine reductase family protein [Streptomyces sp. NBC_00183]